MARIQFTDKAFEWEITTVEGREKILIPFDDVSGFGLARRGLNALVTFELSRPPSFHQYLHKTPCWTPTEDFTGGQASRCRRHVLKFAEGTMEPFHHIGEVDSRLGKLSQTGLAPIPSPYFDGIEPSEVSLSLFFVA